MEAYTSIFVKTHLKYQLWPRYNTQEMANPTKQVDKLRRVPTQKRSRDTFEKILNATADLLHEVGFNAFSTNLLSVRSGISVRAIYRYFPNKHALIMELAVRLAADWRTQLENQNSLTKPEHQSLQTLWPQYLDQFVKAVRNSRGGIAMLQAMRADPELRAFDDEINEGYIREVADALGSSKPDFNTDDAAALARVLLSSTVSVIDSILEQSPQQAETMLIMLKTMHSSLIDKYLSGKPGTNEFHTFKQTPISE